MQQVSSTDEHIGSSILQTVLQTVDRSTILPNLARTIGDRFGADVCLVVSFLAETTRIDDVGYWHQGEVPQQTALQLDSSLFDRQLTGKSAIIDSTTTRLEGIDRQLQVLLPGNSWFGATICDWHRTYGAILLLKQTSPWTSAERELLKQNLDSIEIAISHTQLQKQSQTKTRYQGLLKNISREISQGSQPQLLFPRCLSELCTTLAIDRGSILMLKYQNPLKAKGRTNSSVKGTAKIAYQWSSSAVASEELFFNLTNSALCQNAWRNAPKCLCFPSDTAFPDLTTEQIQPQGSALLMMPLMGKKTSEGDTAMVMGFLVLQHDRERHWSTEERDLIEWMGVQISTALIHHQTLNRVQLIVDERTAQLTLSVDVQAKYHAKMRQHIVQLQKLNQLKDDFMNSMSHELKTPLTSMKMAIEMLRQDIPPQLREKYLDILEQEWHREYNLIKDLLTLQQLESGELDYSPAELNLQQTIATVTHALEEKWRSQGEISLQSSFSHPELTLHTDEDSLKQILTELLTNAGKYGDPDTKIDLTVSRQQTAKGTQIVISIANIGAGITPEELPHIFDKFRRGQGVTDRAVPGTGLGLTLVQYLVEHLNSTIDVTSEPLENDSGSFLTTFVLILPQIQPVIG